MDIKKFDISRLSGNRSFDPAQVGYEDSIEIIEDELQNTRKSFVKIGWYLKHIDEGGMYRQDGYEDIYEFAHARFKMSGGTVNRFINICKQFSVGHDSPELDEQYQEFETSQLFEMLPMKEAEREEISPDMTVRQIREKKAENKAVKEPSEKLIAKFFQVECINLDKFISVSDLKEFLFDRYGKSKSGHYDEDYKFECTLRGISINNCAEITWLTFAKKAWDLKKSNSFDLPEPDEASDIVVPGQTVTPEQTISPVQAESPVQTVVPDEAVIAAACEEKDAVPRKNSDFSGSNAASDTAVILLKEARSLSQKLCDGFRFSSQNHALSQIGEYAEWASALNHTAHALHKLCLEKKLI